MADPKPCSKQEKKKIKLSCVIGTSDGIGGLLVLGLGGILATATVIASYRNKSRKKRGFIKHCSKDLPKIRDPSENSKKESFINGREKGNEGLLSVIQITPPLFQEKNNNSFDEEKNEIVDSSELEEKEVLIHKVKVREEKKPIHGHQEIISDDSKFDDKGISKDQKPVVNSQGLSSSDINGSLIEQGNIIKENSVKDKEVDIHIIDEGEESEKAQVSEMKEEEEGDSDGTGEFSMKSNKQEIWPVESIEQKLLESKSHFQFLEIREEEEEEEEEEEGKGGLDGTGDSSMELNEVEPIEEKPLDMKELKTHFQISPEKIFNQARKAFKEEDDRDEITGKTIKIMESMKEKGLIMVPHPFFGSSSWSMFWVSTMFMAGLLLLLFLNNYVPDFNYFSSFY